MITEEWNRFLQTGKVEDYLASRQKESTERTSATAAFAEHDKGAYALGHAGFCNRDGHGFTDNAHG